jgi:hypothetical protein
MQLTSFASWRTKRETNTPPARTTPWEPGGARNPADASVPALRLVCGERPHRESAAASVDAVQSGPFYRTSRFPASGFPTGFTARHTTGPRAAGVGGTERRVLVDALDHPPAGLGNVCALEHFFFGVGVLLPATARLGVNPFDAEDPDVALLKIGDKLADGIRAEIYGGQIERDVLTGEKAFRTSQTRVEIRKPVHDGRLGCDGESHVGT